MNYWKEMITMNFKPVPVELRERIISGSHAVKFNLREERNGAAQGVFNEMTFNRIIPLLACIVNNRNNLGMVRVAETIEETLTHGKAVMRGKNGYTAILEIA